MLTIKIEGFQETTERLRKLDVGLVQELGQAVFGFAEMVRAHAQHSIVEGSISGPGHVPSLPGEPPNADTRHLDLNIVARRTGILSAEVASLANYSAWLEFGTEQMEERPFMRPALKARTPQGMELIKDAIKAAIAKRKITD